MTSWTRAITVSSSLRPTALHASRRFPNIYYFHCFFSRVEAFHFQCMSANDVFSNHGYENSSYLNGSRFQTVCPTLLKQIIQKSCTKEVKTNGVATKKKKVESAKGTSLHHFQYRTFHIILSISFFLYHSFHIILYTFQ